PGHGQAVLRQRGDEVVVKQPAVLGDYDSHGNSALTVVPPPGLVWMVNVPPRTAALPRMFLNPVPSRLPPATPWPSSETSAMTWPARWRIRMSIRVGLACLRALPTASLTIR